MQEKRSAHTDSAILVYFSASYGSHDLKVQNMDLYFRQHTFFCTPWSQLSPTTNTYKYYPDFHMKLLLMDKFNVFKQPSEKLFLLRYSMDVLGTGNAFLGRSVWITDCLVLLPLQTIGGEKWFPLDWAFCTTWKALMDLWTFFKIKESMALSAMLPWMSKRRWWPSKGFWWGEQFREINTTFSKCFGQFESPCWNLGGKAWLR